MFADLLQALSADTDLCIAADITLQTEYIKTMPVKEWKNANPDLHKKPAIFIIYKQ